MTEQRRDTRAPRLAGIRRGDPIRARWLNGIVAQTNALADSLRPPETLFPIPDQSQDFAVTNDPETQEQPDGEGAIIIWRAVSKVTSTVRVFDPNDSSVWVDVEKDDTIEFEYKNLRMRLELDI